MYHIGCFCLRLSKNYETVESISIYQTIKCTEPANYKKMKPGEMRTKEKGSKTISVRSSSKTYLQRVSTSFVKDTTNQLYRHHLFKLPYFRE